MSDAWERDDKITGKFGGDGGRSSRPRPSPTAKQDRHHHGQAAPRRGRPQVLRRECEVLLDSLDELIQTRGR